MQIYRYINIWSATYTYIPLHAMAGQGSLKCESHDWLQKLLHLYRQPCETPGTGQTPEAAWSIQRWHRSDFNTKHEENGGESALVSHTPCNRSCLWYPWFWPVTASFIKFNHSVSTKTKQTVLRILNFAGCSELDPKPIDSAKAAQFGAASHALRLVVVFLLLDGFF